MAAQCVEKKEAPRYAPRLYDFPASDAADPTRRRFFFYASPCPSSAARHLSALLTAHAHSPPPQPTILRLMFVVAATALFCRRRVDAAASMPVAMPHADRVAAHALCPWRFYARDRCHDIRRTRHDGAPRTPAVRRKEAWRSSTVTLPASFAAAILIEAVACRRDVLFHAFNSRLPPATFTSITADAEAPAQSAERRVVADVYDCRRRAHFFFFLCMSSAFLSMFAADADYVPAIVWHCRFHHQRRAAPILSAPAANA